MNSTAALQKEYFEIGTSPQTGSVLGSSANSAVAFAEFGLLRTPSLKGGIPIDDFFAEIEADAESAQLLAEARQNAVAEFGISKETFRGLRLSAGLSQTLLAKRADTTQSHIANIESAKADPGTEMIVRLAQALGATPAVVFQALCRDRTR